jgi:hypothetical protein
LLYKIHTVELNMWVTNSLLAQLIHTNYNRMLNY